jgi:integrase
MLKNIVLEDAKYLGASTFKLTHVGTGVEIRTFTSISTSLIRNSFRTRKIFGHRAAKFIDFCIEARTQSNEPLSPQRLCDGYLMFLDYGSLELIKLGASTKAELAPSEWLQRVAEVMPQVPLKPKSFDVVVPAMNHVLKAAERVAQEDLRRLQRDSSHIVDDVAILLMGQVEFESERFRGTKFNAAAHSPFADSIRSTGKTVTRPRGLGSRNHRGQDDLRNVPMPLNSFLAVLDNAENSRDESLWSGMAAHGLRNHEILNVKCDEIDYDTGALYVIDPHNRRFGKDITQRESEKFKGRTHSETLLIAPLRYRFYDACARYMREWFVPYPEGTEHQHFFQYIEPSRRGQAYYTVTNEALNDNFRKACQAAQIPPPKGNPKLKWTLYSLRHLYGDYLANEMGLPLADSQAAMGHADSRFTAVYCKRNRNNASKSFEADDRKRFPIDPSDFKSQEES